MRKRERIKILLTKKKKNSNCTKPKMKLVVEKTIKIFLPQQVESNSGHNNVVQEVITCQYSSTNKQHLGREQ